MRGRRTQNVTVAVIAAMLAGLIGCGGGGSAGGGDDAAGRDGDRATAAADGRRDAPGATTSTTASDDTRATGTTAPPVTRPDWLGTRVLDPAQPPPPTPPELDPRVLPTIDTLPPPADGAFRATVAPVPADVAARSTWQEDCPVALDDLRYVTVSFWGFDDEPHTGELLVHRDAAEPLTGVFESLFDARFPIEDVHVTSRAELDAPDTGDGNATAAFVCRPTRGSSQWSEHAYGLAIDINPFQNPYARDGGVIPGLASSYLDRANVRPGMLIPGEGPIEAFAAIGWEWGGAWSNPVDHMHFSAAGR
jgi:hypothetical protein